MGEEQANDSKAMPLDEFIADVMEILKTQPNAKEVCVRKVYPLRFATDLSRHSPATAEGGREKYDQFLPRFNDHHARLACLPVH